LYPPLESGKRLQGFHVCSYRLLLRFLKRAREEKLTGLTKFEIALYVMNMLEEDDDTAFTTEKVQHSILAIPGSVSAVFSR